MRFLLPAKTGAFVALFLLLQLFPYDSTAQMRKIYLDSDEDVEVYSASFYTAAEGYVAANRWIGYTTDSGKTYSNKFITASNVDYNGYPANITFGFGIWGVKAFDKNNIVVYGDYGLVPAILVSSNGGNNFKLVYHSQYNSLQLSTGVTDMVFPGDGSTGYAVDADRVLKSTDKGLTWTIAATFANSYFTEVQAVDANNVYAISNDYRGAKVVRTTNGTAWSTVTLPSLSQGRLEAACFLSATTGWVNMTDNNGKKYVHRTTSGGSSWTLMNDPSMTPFSGYRMRFTDANTGYALVSQNKVYKTVNGGAIWEQLPRDNDFTHLGYSHNKLDFFSANQFWTGGRHGFLEMTNNGGGTPLPKAIFRVDTIGLGATGNVKLSNFSRKDYSYRWLLNGNVAGTSYDLTYPRDMEREKDTIQLIVYNGTSYDTATRYQQFHPPVIISSFTPAIAGKGTVVTITGANLSKVFTVRFGGVDATDVKVISATQITAKVGNGATGDILLISTTGYGKKPGFTFIPPPVVNNFSPQSAIAGTKVTITGSEFNYLTGVSFAGVPATSYQLISPGVIEAVVPSGGDGAVSIHTAGGTGSLAGFIALPVVKSFTPQKGTEGTVMTIKGTSFTGANRITVGGIDVLSFTVDSSTGIKALVGPGNSGDVKVFKTGGESALAGFTWFIKPIITSFAPASGPVGTTVTITGSGFHPTPTNNIVRFGGVKATVTGGNATSLTVKVPAGTSYDPISVISNNLSAYSVSPFVVTFSGGSINAGSFAPAKSAYQYAYWVGVMRQADLNNDGRTDIITGEGTDLYFFRNTTTGTDITFEGTYTQSKLGVDASLADLDGDGRIDVVATASDSAVVLRNISPANGLAFEKHTLTKKSTFDNVLVLDIDGDGKMDVVVPNQSVSVKVFRNISEGGILAFEEPTSIFWDDYGRLLMEDINGDGKADILDDNTDVNGVLWYRPNTSRKGLVSFGKREVVPFKQYTQMQKADIDGDGKQDLLSMENARIYVHRSTGGAGDYAKPVPVDATENQDLRFSLSDMDGDGRVDIVFKRLRNAMRVMKNLSKPGFIVFAPPVDYDPSNPLYGLVLADVNNDGKPDVVASPKGKTDLMVYANQVQAAPFVESFSPTNGLVGTIVTIKGINFTNTYSVSFGNMASASFKVLSDSVITAELSYGNSGAVSVTTALGTGARSGFTVGVPPVITSFSPAAAPAGASVTIRGNNFSPFPALNHVLFGGIKASVTSASSTELVVTVPQSAGHRPITVTVAGYTGTSTGKFNLTWPGATDNFSVASFAQPVKVNKGGSNAFDMDGDGLLDLCDANTISRNISVPGNIAFAVPDTIVKGVTWRSYFTADMDGDKDIDIAVTSYGSPNFYILKNFSTPGKYNFIGQGLYAGGYTGQTIIQAVIDIDGDGKLDVITRNESQYNLCSFFRNLSSGDIDMAPRIDYPVNGSVSFADLDEDLRPDMVIAGYSGSVNQLMVRRNISIPGTIEFADEVPLTTPVAVSGINFTDLDGDGKTDIVLSSVRSVEHLLNKSTPGYFSFQRNSSPVDLVGATVVVSDLDGDGKTDVNLFGDDNMDKRWVSFLKNNSGVGSIGFKTPYSFQPYKERYSGSHADIDGDGRPDIIVTMGVGSSHIFRNTTGMGEALKLCAGTNTTINADLTGSSYQWQVNIGDGFVNLPENAGSKGVTTPSLQLTNIPATWQYAEIRCVVDGNRYGRITKLDMPPTIKPSVTMSASTYDKICAGTPVTFTAYPQFGGSSPVFQWLKNDQPVGTNSPTYVPTDLRDYDVVSVQLSSSVTCPSAATVKSTNSVAVRVGFRSLDVSISGVTKVVKGDRVSIRARLSNGDLYAHYEWQDSTDASGWKHVASGLTDFPYAPPVEGAKLRCYHTSYEACITGSKTFYSNTLTFNVMDVATLSTGVRSYPNPVTTRLTIELLNASNDHWESMSITGPAGVRTLEMNNIGGRSSLVVDVSSWAKGYYVVKLSRRDGPPHYHKFMKL